MQNVKKAVIGYLVGFLLLSGLFYYIGIDRILSVLSGFQIVFLLPIIIIYPIILCVNALNIKILLSPIRKVGYSSLLKKYLLSYSIGAILPSKLGEFSLAYLMRKSVPMGKSTAVLLIDKFVSLAIMSAFSIMAMLYFFGFQEALYLLLTLILVFSLALALVLSEKIRGMLKKTIFSRIKHHFKGFSKTFKHYFKHQRKIIFANVLLTLSRLSLQSIWSFVLFLGFGVAINPVILLYILSINTILMLFFFTPRGLGITQVSLVFFISLLGVDPAIAMGVSLISYMVYYGYVLIILYIYGIKKLKFLN